jgi:predicted SAM-dependent methyltransferase
VRLNLGSGQYLKPGWVNVDAFCDADVEGDIRLMDFENVAAVRMSHLLEHISWRETVPVLERIRSWMAPGGVLTVEVPDMDAIMGRGTVHPLWFKYVYGDQSHGGEYHLAGFTANMLKDQLHEAGWSWVVVRRFESTHKGREGMPCLEAMARV